MIILHIICIIYILITLHVIYVIYVPPIVAYSTACRLIQQTKSDGLKVKSHAYTHIYTFSTHVVWVSGIVHTHIHIVHMLYGSVV